MLTMSTRVDVTNPNWHTELRTAYALKYDETASSLDQPRFQRLLRYVFVIQSHWKLNGEDLEDRRRTFAGAMKSIRLEPPCESRPSL